MILKKLMKSSFSFFKRIKIRTGLKDHAQDPSYGSFWVVDGERGFKDRGLVIRLNKRELLPLKYSKGKVPQILFQDRKAIKISHKLYKIDDSFLSFTKKGYKKDFYYILRDQEKDQDLKRLRCFLVSNTHVVFNLLESDKFLVFTFKELESLSKDGLFFREDRVRFSLYKEGKGEDAPLICKNLRYLAMNKAGELEFRDQKNRDILTQKGKPVMVDIFNNIILSDRNFKRVGYGRGDVYVVGVEEYRVLAVFDKNILLLENESIYKLIGLDNTL